MPLKCSRPLLSMQWDQEMNCSVPSAEDGRGGRSGRSLGRSGERQAEARPSAGTCAASALMSRSGRRRHGDAGWPVSHRVDWFDAPVDRRVVCGNDDSSASRESPAESSEVCRDSRSTLTAHTILPTSRKTATLTQEKRSSCFTTRTMSANPNTRTRQNESCQYSKNRDRRILSAARISAPTSHLLATYCNIK